MANTAINHDPVATFPGSSTNTAVVKWSGTSGNALLDSGVIIDASNNVTGLNNVTATGYLHLTGDEKELRFYEGANYIAIAAPSGLGADYTFTLPLNDGSADEFLQTNGSGVLTWAAAGQTTLSGSTNNTIVTITGANALLGEANLTFDGTNLTVGTGNVIIGTAGKGIDFSAQASPAAGMTSELLDHYEEGTFSPGIADSDKNPTGESQTYSRRIGRYTRIGNRVIFNIRMTVTSLGSLTSGSASFVTGLPFTSNTTSASHQACYIAYASGMAITAGVSPVGQVVPSLADIELYMYSATTGAAVLLISNLTNALDIMIGGHYDV